MKKKTVIDFIPSMAAAFVSVVCLLVYFFAFHKSNYVDILKACVVPVAALVIPLLNLIFKIRIPYALNIAVAAYAVVALDGASVLSFYEYIPHYDKFLHTAFGIVGSFAIFTLLLYGRGEKMKPWCFFLTIMLCVLGVAAFWEIYEYAGTAIFHYDMQHWMPNMSEVGDMTVSEFFKSYDPLWDTIWDIIVAVFGVLMFYLIVLVDKFCGYKMCKSIYLQVISTRKPAKKAEEEAPSEEKSEEKEE